ncbi:hypothetical protein DACRYDRAFT_62409 [Dacryopinax primogenitus]|uniref:Splicing factor 3B subunit 4 n=1 Tax=Dacryopinax primogenitus (strain DJM 731) TaxID=1858805 RepID=M5G670_DACPD|nr:uncharacterized protein DACRYDRAFT_62409 [Dacryopinax primogenitus]EJU05756.1 hypothetical protein DACRYDRAFT_62409 [Dacryopinax primogenitus]
MSKQQEDRNQEATVYLGNLDERVTDAIIWELMLQAGPVVNVHLPKDRISMAHQGYGFCEFLTEEDAEYACKIMNQIKLWGKPIRVNKASSDKKQLDVGANLFIGNLDPNVDERLLYDTFSAFGILTQPAKIARDPQTSESKGYGFISYSDFESSDRAIESMNNQFLMNKAITVQYAFKKDGKGERHGTDAERMLASQAKKNNALPLGLRPPPAPMGILPGSGGPMGYQGQFAGVLSAGPAAALPSPFGIPNQPMMQYGAAPPPPPGVPVYNPAVGAPGMPPPPPGFQAQAGYGMSGYPQGMPPPPSGFPQGMAFPPPGVPMMPPGMQVPPAGFIPQNGVRS